MMGDTGVAVNPEDEKFKHLIGKTCILPIMNREIPIVGDEYCEIGFGTGAVKMTPAHDPNDFEVGLRHNLEVIRVLNDDGTVNENGGKYQGMDRYECRKAIVADLEAEGYLVKTEPYSHNVGTCYRCHNDVEPLISAQWFVRMKPLAEEAIRVIKDGTIRFVPERFSKTYLNWMENVRDWCISRQLWWGHQIPAWTCADCGHMTVSRQDAQVCEACGSARIERDPDVLDTWFSSALWPFETLGWPEQTQDLADFYPTDVLVTGYDIIFFWVARMIFSACAHTGRPPFHTVLIHGLVRDDKGRKMSKSLGNGIDPLQMIDRYGCDALRMNMVTGNSPGNDMRFYMERCEAMRNFANKLWNASRYVLMNVPEGMRSGLPAAEKLEIADKWVLSKLNTLISEVTDNLERYELGIAVQKVYDFLWDTYCDWYIEMVKPRLYNQEDPTRNAALWTLKTVLINALKMLHPFMPFVTEEIFTAVQSEEETIMYAKWPEYSEEFNFAEDEKSIELMKEAIKSIRNIRAEMNVAPSKKAKVIVVSENEEVRDIFEKGKVFFAPLAYASEVAVQSDKSGISDDAVSTAIHNGMIYMPFAELVDIEKEKERLVKEKEKLVKEVERVEKKLSNQGFVSKAPEKVINEEKAKLEKYSNMLKSVEEQIERLK